MMMKVKITCDSTCDLSPELYVRYGVSVIPCVWHWETVSVRMGWM